MADMQLAVMVDMRPVDTQVKINHSTNDCGSKRLIICVRVYFYRRLRCRWWYLQKRLLFCWCSCSGRHFL